MKFFQLGFISGPAEEQPKTPSFFSFLLFLLSLFSREFPSSIFLLDFSSVVCHRPASHQLPAHPSFDPHHLLPLPGLAPEPLARRKRRKLAGDSGKLFAGNPTSGHHRSESLAHLVALIKVSIPSKGISLFRCCYGEMYN